MLNSSERRVLDARISDLAKEHMHTEALAHGAWALPATDIYTFMIPRRNDVMYIACPDINVVQRAVRGITPIVSSNAKVVPMEERRQLYDWARVSHTFIPDLMPGHFVRIRRPEATHALTDFAGDLAYVSEISANLDDPNMDVIRLYLVPRLMYKNDDVNAIRLLPTSNRVERSTQTFDPSEPKAAAKPKKKHKVLPVPSDVDTSQPRVRIFRDVGLMTIASIRHGACVSTSDSLDNHDHSRDMGIQTIDCSVFETQISISYPDLSCPLSSPSTYREASCGTDEAVSVSVGDACVQANLASSPKHPPRPSQKKQRPPQRLFLPDLIEQELPGALSRDADDGSLYRFEGNVYKHGMRHEEIQGYKYITRAWPTTEEAWMFVYQGLGRSLIVNMAYLRVGDVVGIHSQNVSLHVTAPIMTGTVHDISHLTVQVKVQGHSEMVISNIQSVWRIFKEGDWVEDMMIRKGQLSMVLNVYPDDSLDLCYWDKKRSVQRNEFDLRKADPRDWEQERLIHHYRSYSWYFRTAEPPSTLINANIPSTIRQPLVVKAEPKDARMRRKYRDYFIGKEVYVHEGQFKGRICRVVGIGKRKAIVVFDGRPEKYEMHLTSAINM